MNLGIKIYGVLVGVIAIVAMVVGMLAYVQQVPVDSEGNTVFGAAGNMLAEEYIPYVLYNEGYNSAKDIKTTGNFYSTAGTFTGALIGTSGAFSSGLTVSAGDTRLVSLVETGVTTTFSASSTSHVTSLNTLSASAICNQKIIPINIGNTSTLILNLPSTTTLFADCLTTDGDFRTFVIKNSSTTRDFTLAAGAGMTLAMSSSTNGMFNGTRALMTCWRETAGTMYCQGVNSDT
jgi:hypothetical protein